MGPYNHIILLYKTASLFCIVTASQKNYCIHSKEIFTKMKFDIQSLANRLFCVQFSAELQQISQKAKIFFKLFHKKVCISWILIIDPIVITHVVTLIHLKAHFASLTNFSYQIWVWSDYGRLVFLSYFYNS